VTTPALYEWRVTFGQQYAHNPHPTFPAAHPDGWVTVHAPTEKAARDATLALLGTRWAWMYAMGDARSISGRSEDGDRVNWAVFPRGEHHRITM
jgi:hypothetical protein